MLFFPRMNMWIRTVSTSQEVSHCRRLRISCTRTVMNCVAVDTIKRGATLLEHSWSTCLTQRCRHTVPWIGALKSCRQACIAFRREAWFSERAVRFIAYNTRGLVEGGVKIACKIARHRPSLLDRKCLLKSGCSDTKLELFYSFQ